MKLLTRDMINIYCAGGAYYDVDIDYNLMMHLLKDGVLSDDDFIEFTFSDGTKGAVRKGHIDGICECLEEV